MIYLDKRKEKSPIVVQATALDIESTKDYFLQIYSYNHNPVLRIKLGTNLSHNRNRFDEWEIDLAYYEDLFLEDYYFEIQNEDGTIFDRGTLRMQGEATNEKVVPNNFKTVDINVPNDFRSID